MATITLTWVDTSNDDIGLISDVLHGCIYNPIRNEVIPIPPVKTRGDEEQDVELPASWQTTDHFHIWAAWRRADGLDASDTMYYVITTP
jgi:hypothetical protein